MLCYGPLVSELGGGRVHGAPPNPVIGRAGAPFGSATDGNKHLSIRLLTPTTPIKYSYTTL